MHESSWKEEFIPSTVLNKLHRFPTIVHMLMNKFYLENNDFHAQTYTHTKPLHKTLLQIPGNWRATLKFCTKEKTHFQILPMKIQYWSHLTKSKVLSLPKKHIKHYLTIICRIKSATCCFLLPPNEIISSFLSSNLFFTSKIRKKINLWVFASVFQTKRLWKQLLVKKFKTEKKRRKEQVWYFTITSAPEVPPGSRSSSSPSFSKFLLAMRLIFPVALNSLDLTDMENVTKNL